MTLCPVPSRAVKSVAVFIQLDVPWPRLSPILLLPRDRFVNGNVSAVLETFSVVLIVCAMTQRLESLGLISMRHFLHVHVEDTRADGQR